MDIERFNSEEHKFLLTFLQNPQKLHHQRLSSDLFEVTH